LLCSAFGTTSSPLGSCYAILALPDRIDSSLLMPGDWSAWLVWLQYHCNCIVYYECRIRGRPWMNVAALIDDQFLLDFGWLSNSLVAQKKVENFDLSIGCKCRRLQSI
jgi:hypothetical protein